MKKIISLFSLFVLSANSMAHTPYLKPMSFEPARGGIVSLDAAFAEKFFVPDVAFANSIYYVIAPDGKQSQPDILNQLKTRVVVEHQLNDEGTYRFSTGKRYGRIFKRYELDGEQKSMRDPSQPIPEGAKVISHFQSLTRAETYITQGPPNSTVIAPSDSGLEFIPQSHPNELFTGEAFELISFFDGKPLPDLNVDVFVARDQFTDDKPTFSLVSDEKGVFSFTPEVAGNYLIMARHRTDAPENWPAPQISNTYSLVIEVVQ